MLLPACSGGVIKLHTLLDLRGNIPTFVWLTDGTVHDVRALDVLIPEPGSIYVLDRAYVDFERLWRLHEARAIFVTGAKKNLRFRRRYSAPVDRTTGLVCDQTIVLTGRETPEHYPAPLRRIRSATPSRARRSSSSRTSSPFRLSRSPSSTGAVGKWSSSSSGSSSTSVSSRSSATRPTRSKPRSESRSRPTCSSRSCGSGSSSSATYTMLQILSVYPFEKVPLSQLLAGPAYTPKDGHIPNQLSLFDL